MDDAQQEEKKTLKGVLSKYEWDVKAAGAVALVSGMCVEGVVAAAVVGLVPAETKTKRIKRMVAAHCIAAMVAKEASGWAGKSAQDIFGTIKETIKKVQEEEAAKQEEEVDD